MVKNQNKMKQDKSKVIKSHEKVIYSVCVCVSVCVVVGCEK